MIKLADAVRKKLITEGECATLVLQGIKRNNYRQYRQAKCSKFN